MKKILGIFLSLILLISLSINVTSANTELTPISLYSFDNDSGSKVIDSIGSNDGTNMGATYVEGWNGQGKALSFNGTNSYVQFNQGVIPVGKKSIRFKIKSPNKPTGPIYPIGEIAQDKGFYFGVNASGLLSFRNWDGTVNQYYVSTSIDIYDNKWHDILFTWDGTVDEGGVKLYVDDMTTPIAVAKSSVTIDYSSGAALTLGRKSSSYFKGEIDEIEIYNEVIEPIKQPETVQSKLFVGNKSAYKLTIDGEVYSWGENSYGQLGLGDTKKRTVSQKEKVNLPEKITNLVMGQNFVIALGESGTVYGWGDNASGVLADGDVIIKEPIEVDSEITELIEID